MVLIIATDEHPVVAIRRTVSRVGFVLLPISFLYIKYFPDLGRVYDVDGNLMNTGVQTNKNSLGLTVLVVSLVVVWNLRSLLTQQGRTQSRAALGGSRHIARIWVGIALDGQLLNLPGVLYPRDLSDACIKPWCD